MTYYVVVNNINNGLLSISESEPLNINVSVENVICKEGPIPDLSKCYWHPETLSFITRNRFLSKKEFLDRLEQEELVQIYTLAKQDINVEVWLDKFRLSLDIDLDDPDLFKALTLFELVGLMKPGRVKEILA